MDRDQPFTRYLHDAQQRVEVPMHGHINGQLNYVHKGTMRLLSPRAHWVVPWRRLVWIPPDQLHSVRCEGLSGSWKAMIPRAYAQFLPGGIAVLRTGPLLLAALEALPARGAPIAAARLAPLIEIIRQELSCAQNEGFGITLPTTEPLRRIADILLEDPEDPRQIDDWTKVAGMSRRTFTRRFLAETGSSFGQWKRNMLLGKALGLLAEERSVSEIADRLGYANPSAFIAAFKRKYGASPRRFARSERDGAP